MGYHSLADIRKFLMAAFSDEEIMDLCFDSFPEVYDIFSAGMTRSEKARRLVEYCLRRGQIRQLLSAIREARPGQFEQRFDGILDATPSTLPSPSATRDLLNRLIENKHQAVQRYWFFSIGLCALGVTIMASAYLLPARIIPETLNHSVMIGGCLVSSLGLFQCKEILSRREKIGVFRTIESSLSAIDSVDAYTRKHVDDLLWQAIEETALR